MKRVSSFEAAALAFAHAVFIRGIIRTPERRQSTITTEELALSHKLQILTGFEGKKNASCEAFPKRFQPQQFLIFHFLLSFQVYLGLVPHGRLPQNILFVGINQFT